MLFGVERRSPDGPGVLIEIHHAIIQLLRPRASSDCGIVRPSAPAVLRLIASLFQLLMFLDCTRREKPIANRFISANTRWTGFLRYYHQAAA
jgi:hypothetical protein